MYKILLLFIIVAVSLENALGMSRAQLKKTLTITKKQCMPKIGVTEDKVGKIEQGVFIAEHDVMCYISCIYKNIQVIKNERLDKGLVIKQVDALYPQEMRAAVKAGVDKCFSVQDNYSDPCEGVFYSVKCLYEADPPNFIFP